jgi:peptide/nickel transport system substrate-binding protein
MRTKRAATQPVGASRRWRVAFLLAASLSVIAAAWGGVAPNHRAGASSTGGSVNALEASAFAGDWNSLDPATDTNSAANQSILSAIYGELFEQGPGGKIVPDLASGYKITNGGLTVDIDIRPGVQFQDGTPFTAQAVAFNIKRDLEPQYACTCAPNFPLSSVTAVGNDTVVLQLTHPFAPIIEAFFLATPNWIVSPTALGKVSEQTFALHPVGAGPFEVLSAVPNSVVRLKRNPGYWEKGHPKLSSLTFTSIGTDASAIDGLESGQAQVYEGLGSVSLAGSARRAGLKLCKLPAIASYYISLNTSKPPFNNILAREAIYYATDPQPILKSVFDNQATISQAPGGPGALYYEAKVPGYRTYNLAKAKALVKQLGGLSVSLEDLTSITNDEVIAALQTQWSKAGIKTTLQELTVTALVQAGEAGKQQAVFSSVGSYDPALVPGLEFFFSSKSPLSSVHDPHLDALLDQASAIPNPKSRAASYRQVYKYMSDMAYAPFLFTTVGYNVMTKSVQGIPCNTLSESTRWENVSVR